VTAFVHHIAALLIRSGGERAHDGVEGSLTFETYAGAL
jgi:hypothetical protein